MTKINIKKFKKALKDSGGVKSIIAQKIGCELCAVYRFLKKNPKMQELLEAEDNRVTDLAENKLLKKIENGDWKAVKFRLDRRHKAYRPKQEITTTQDVRLSKEEATEHVDKFLKKKDKITKNPVDKAGQN